MVRAPRRVARLMAVASLTAIAAMSCTPSPDGWPFQSEAGEPPAVAAVKDPDAIRVAVVGDSLLARDCWTCSPLAMPVNGGEEEIRPILDADPHIDVRTYTAVPGATLRTHPGLAAAIASSPDELVIDLHVNDAFQIAMGNTDVATVEASIDAVLADAAEAGISCVRWISYPTRWTTEGVWTLLPGARSSLLVLAAHVRGAVALHHGRAAMIEWGPLAEQIDDAGVSVIDSRDSMHFLNSVAPTFGETIRRAVGSECA